MVKNFFTATFRNLFRASFIVPIVVYDSWRKNEKLFWGEIGERLKIDPIKKRITAENLFFDYALVRRLHTKTAPVSEKWIINNDPAIPSVVEIDVDFYLYRGMGALKKQQTEFIEFFKNHFFGESITEEEREYFHLNKIEYLEPEDPLCNDDWAKFDDCDSPSWKIEPSYCFQPFC